jgi:pyruvate dehydrogenase E2 component (dihydrolipoamide acetyltransferase)
VSEFTMPSLGADMEAGTLVEWLVSPGDTVKHGDVVAVVETQKGAIEIEIFEDGVIESIQAKVGERLPVGAPLARLRPVGAPASAEPEEHPAPPAPTVGSERPPPPAIAPAVPPPARATASPAARARAAEAGLDLAALTGSGPGGAILLADVEAALGRKKEAAGAETATPTPVHRGLDLDAMRVAIAAAMARSKREIPHYYLTHTVDLQPATDWLGETNATRDPDRRLLMGALFVKASARAATQVQQINGHYVDDRFRPSVSVNVGVAVALRGGGLIAPAIRDAAALALDDLMAALRDLVARARTGRLRSSEMTDGTITVSSLGDGGADALTGVIYPPQVALVGFGTPVRRPWVMVDDAVVPRTVVTITLAADHRASDGRRGAKFLATIDKLLQNPEAL